MKKVSLLTLALSMTAAGVATAQAPVANPCPCPKAFQGFFLGGNIGYGIGSVKEKARNDVAIAGVVFPGSSEPVLANNLGVQGFDGGLNVGYTHRLGNFGLGIEGVFNWANSKGQNYSAPLGGAYASRLRLKESAQLRGNFSYVICNLVAPKIILGWDSSRWERRFIANAGNTSATKNTNRARFNGFLWGAGVDFLLAKHVIAGLEYTGVSSGSKSFKSSVTSKDEVTTTTHKVKPIYNKFALTVKFIY